MIPSRSRKFKKQDRGKAIYNNHNQRPRKYKMTNKKREKTIYWLNQRSRRENSRPDINDEWQ